MDIIEYINESKDRKIGGTSYTEKDLCAALMYDIENILMDNEMENDVTVIELWAHGSRMRGDYRPDSDIDIVVFYYADYVKEDALMNILNKEGIEIEGHNVDFNPILVDSDRDIKAYKKKSEKYDLEKLKKNGTNK